MDMRNVAKDCMRQKTSQCVFHVNKRFVKDKGAGTVYLKK